MTTQYAIETHSLSKKFTRKGGEQFLALQNIDIQLPQSSVLALIGSNGAGKSTLLKILSGLIKPSSGKVVTRGRVASVLEIGSGFHPDLTGRENVYMSSSLAGFSNKETDTFFDAIVDFSELSDWIDEPVKKYSSGMYLRLAFSTIINWNTEILLLDEVMSVGDAGFREKCLDFIKKLSTSETTLVIAGHNIQEMDHVASHALWLEDGQHKSFGKYSDVCEGYLKTTLFKSVDTLSHASLNTIQLESGISSFGSVEHTSHNIRISNSIIASNPPETALNTSAFTLKNVYLETDESNTEHFVNDNILHLRINYLKDYTYQSIQIAVHIHSIYGNLLSVFNMSCLPDYDFGEATKGEYEQTYTFAPYHFNAGTYYIDLIVSADYRTPLGIAKKVLLFKVEENSFYANSPWSGLPVSIQACPQHSIQLKKPGL